MHTPDERPKGVELEMRDDLVIVIRHADDRDDRAEGFLEDQLRFMRHEIDA